MAGTFTARPVAFGRAMAGRIWRLRSTVGRWNDVRVTRKALSTLSDWQLDDIGLMRCDIENFA